MSATRAAANAAIPEGRGGEAVAVAHPNIALSKYWGKRASAGNFPAVPSLSLTLDGLQTRTRVSFAEHATADEVVINGERATGKSLTRVVALLDRVRAEAGMRAHASVDSTNDFPTASGLASSASGFAALALAATRAAGLAWDAPRISDLARRGSASAARSMFEGLVELPAGALDVRESDMLSARSLVPAADVDLRVIVCVTTEGSKAHGSTDAMRVTAEKSRLYAAWVEAAPAIHAALKAAVLAGDWSRAGELTEESTLTMHACAMSAGFVYFSGATIEAMHAVRSLRAQGLPVFFTMDAGPHVKVFVPAANAERVAASMRDVPGVLRTIVCAPGGAARVEAP